MKASSQYFNLKKCGKVFSLFSIIFFLSACKQSDTALKRGYYSLDFTSLTFENNEVTFGDSSDIVIPGLPRNAFSILTKGDSKQIIWKANYPIYFKLNGVTQNRVNNKGIRELMINRIPIPIEKFNSEIEKLKTSKGERIGKREPSEIFNEFDQNYIPLSRFLKNISKQLHTEDLRSFYSTKDTCFILLDTILKIVPNEGQPKEYKFSDTSTSNRLEFFTILNYSNYPTDSTKKHVRNDDTCYHIKVQPFFTNFGASTFYFLNNLNNSKTSIEFDKPFRFCYSKKLLQDELEANNNLPINIVQDYQATSFTNDIVVPNFSYSKQQSFGQMESTEKRPSISSTFTFHSVPSPFRSIIPLTIVFIIIFLSYFYSPVSKYKIKNLYLINESGQERTSWKSHFLTLNSILFIFLIYRIFIAFQLSYTGPFFTYFLPMQTLIAPMMLILVNWCWTSFALFKSIIPEPNKPSQVANMRIYNNLFTLVLVFISVVLSVTFSNEIGSFYSLRNLIGGSIFSKSSIFSPLNVLIILYAFIASILFFQLLLKLLLKVELIQSLSLKVKALLISRLKLLTSEFGGNKTRVWLKKSGAKRIYVSIIMSTLILFITSFFISNGYSVLLLIALLLNQYFAFTTPLPENPTNWHLIFYNYILPFFITSGVMVFAALKGDSGFVINLYLVYLFVWICFLFKEDGAFVNTQDKRARRKILVRFVGYLIIWFALIAGGTRYVSNYTGTPDELRNRTKSRLTALYDFTKMQEFGLKGSESITQFFAVLAKYSEPDQGELYSNYFHPAICGYSDPVIINDLSFPCAGISPWGKFYSVHIFILLAVLLPILVFRIFKSSFYSRPDYDKTKDKQGRLVEERNHLTAFGIIRIICLAYMVGSILWLVLSYYGIVPFTGRLVFGLGQDSVAEVLETVILYFGMGIVYNHPSIKRKVV